MCELCGTDEERKEGQEHARRFADELQRMAKYQRGLASGTIRPHSDDMKPVSLLARSIIRKLVNEYL